MTSPTVNLPNPAAQAPAALKPEVPEIDEWLEAQRQAVYLDQEPEELTLLRCTQVLEKCGGDVNKAEGYLSEIYQYEFVERMLDIAKAPESAQTAATCPKCRTGRLVERHKKASSERFWGCSGYPDCEYVASRSEAAILKAVAESNALSAAPTKEAEEITVQPYSGIRSKPTANAEESLAFPEAGYVGAPAEIADLYAQHYETPKEFIYMDQLTLIGTMISGRVTVTFGDLKVQPRLYTIKVARSGWSRKSTATEFAEGVIRKAHEHDGSLLFYEDLDPAPLKVIYGVGSAEGLIRQFRHYEELAKPNEDGKKGRWAGYPRIVLSFDEFRVFEKKARGESSVLLYAANQLYGRNVYDNATREHVLSARNAHLGLIANTTDETWRELLQGGELRDVGFLNRVFIVTSNTQRRIACPVPIPKERLEPPIAQLRKLFDGLPDVGDDGKCKEPMCLPLTVEARSLWTSFYENITETEATTRLDVIGMRLMVILAFVSGKSEVDAEIVSAAIALLQYQHRVRLAFEPIIGDSPRARLESRIYQQHVRRGALTFAECYRHANGHRHAVADFKAAYKAVQEAFLEEAGSVKDAAGKATKKYDLRGRVTAASSHQP
jgi:hypothetical protein